MKTLLELVIQYPLLNFVLCVLASVLITFCLYNVLYKNFQERQTKEDTYALLEKYKVIIERFSYPDKSPSQLLEEGITSSSWRTLSHVYWMIIVCLEKKHNIRKLNRWLGYIQCILFLNGLVTEKDLRSDSRGL